MDQVVPQVEVPWPASRRLETTALENFRSNFIARPTNTYATVHYDVASIRASSLQQPTHSPGEDSSGGSPPSGMEESHSPPGRYQVHRNAIGHCDREQDAGPARNPTIDSFFPDPSPGGIDLEQLHSVDLVPQDNSGEARHLPPQGQPTAHHFANRLVTPEPQIEAPAGVGTAPGYAGGDTVSLPPFEELVARDCARYGALPDLGQHPYLRLCLPAASRPRRLPIHPLDLGTQGPEPLIDALISALDLPHVVDGASALRGERRQQHGHAGPDVRRLDRPTFQG
jgi:hypothetical protein